MKVNILAETFAKKQPEPVQVTAWRAHGAPQFDYYHYWYYYYYYYYYCYYYYYYYYYLLPTIIHRHFLSLGLY